MAPANSRQPGHSAQTQISPRTAACHTLSWLGFVFLWLFAGLAQAASFSAQVDRHELQLGESLLLTLELDRPDYFVDPDISALHKHFELLSSSHQPLIEEQGQSVSRWLLRLQPKQAGVLTIPALPLGELRSTPLTIQVEAPTAKATPVMEPVYIDSSLDHEELYLQAQAVLTVKIYHSIPLYSDGQLSPLAIESARIQPLGEASTYQQYIHGIRYGVIEMRYAIFPQATGILTIAPQTFVATLAGDDDSSLQTRHPPAPGRKIQVKSASIPLKVNPPPAEFPADAVWLPARALHLQQQLSPDSNQASLEQALEYTIVLEADGQPASALPALLPGHLPGFRLYGNPPVHAQNTSTHGVHTRQEEQLLLVALQPGSLALPALRLPWWNTTTDTLEWATGQAQQLEIFDPNPNTQTTTKAPATADHRLWQLTSLLLAALCLILAFLWRRARRLPAVAAPAVQKNTVRLLEDLRKACQANQPQQARTLLDQWLRHSNYSLAGLPHAHPELQAAMRELNQVLYSPGEQLWDGNRLWQVIHLLASQQQQDDTQQLPPLYPP